MNRRCCSKYYVRQHVSAHASSQIGNYVGKLWYIIKYICVDAFVETETIFRSISVNLCSRFANYYYM